MAYDLQFSLCLYLADVGLAHTSHFLQETLLYINHWVCFSGDSLISTDVRNAVSKWYRDKNFKGKIVSTEGRGLTENSS